MFCCFFLLLISSSALSHDFHLSKCDIEFNESEKSLQFTLSVFIDDLEEAIARQFPEKLYILTDKESLQADIEISKYLLSKIKISVDGQFQRLNFLGKEAGEDISSMWCYLEISNVLPQSEIAIEFDLLTEVFNDQRNLVKLQYNKSKKFYFIFNKADYTNKVKIK